MCSTSCPATCRSLYAPSRCPKKCREGCVCDEGFVLSGDQCVPLSQCGCVHRGFYYKPGETFYPNGFCKQRCSCQAGGIVECHHFSCGPNEECRVVDGIQKCHPVVPRTGTCHAAGDPHYLTFDGYPFDFQGNCTYVLAKSCVRKGYLPSFAIHVKNERLGRTKAAVTSTVSIIVYKRTFTLVRNRNGVVLVNGRPVRLPARPSRAVSVSRARNVVTVAQGSALRVLFSTSGDVTVRIDGKLARKVQAACGNYNGNSADDLRLPDGTVLDNIGEVLSYWRFSENPQDGTWGVQNQEPGFKGATGPVSQIGIPCPTSDQWAHLTWYPASTLPSMSPSTLVLFPQPPSPPQIRSMGPSNPISPHHSPTSDLWAHLALYFWNSRILTLERRGVKSLLFLKPSLFIIFFRLRLRYEFLKPSKDSGHPLEIHQALRYNGSQLSTSTKFPSPDPCAEQLTLWIACNAEMLFKRYSGGCPQL
ncbi:hypothetical protein G0U57_018022 [Chelydra serpentina]|uniref:VWFD domain-containing protein n=1 Tax=Chelydra serpentina TaxID=8475 RepID=A0A8T1S5U5_CHESE|nr:hypothetical protein G0U57_018022 [Chelydra serpentina]